MKLAINAIEAAAEFINAANRCPADQSNISKNRYAVRALKEAVAGGAFQVFKGRRICDPTITLCNNRAELKVYNLFNRPYFIIRNKDGLEKYTTSSRDVVNFLHDNFQEKA